MHYHAEVWIPEYDDRPATLEAAVMNEIERFKEEYKDEDGNWQYREDGWWDWFQIGGRWDGVHTPTNVAHVDNISNELTCARLVLGEKIIEEEYTSFATGFNVKAKLTELGFNAGGYLVTVDYHI